MAIIAGIISAVGSLIAAAAPIVKGLVVTGLAIDAIKKIGQTLMKIGQALGIIKPETKVDELGDKALQAEKIDGIKPDDFDNIEEYIKTVESRKLDPNLSKEFTDEQKIEKGTQLVTALCIGRFGKVTTENFINVLKERVDHFDEARSDALGKILVGDDKNMASTLDCITGYLNNSEKDGKKLDLAIEKLVDIEKTSNPKLTDEEAKAIVLNL